MTEPMIRNSPPTISTHAKQQRERQLGPTGARRIMTPSTTYRRPMSNVRKNPLHSRVQKLPTSWATPAIKRSEPSTTAVAMPAARA